MIMASSRALTATCDAMQVDQPLPDPVEVQPLLWQQSQVQPGTELGKDGVAALAIDSMPMLVMAGDSVSGSNFENCIRSATQAAELVVEAVGREQAAL